MTKQFDFEEFEIGVRVGIEVEIGVGETGFDVERVRVGEVHDEHIGVGKDGLAVGCTNQLELKKLMFRIRGV